MPVLKAYIVELASDTRKPMEKLGRGTGIKTVRS